MQEKRDFSKVGNFLVYKQNMRDKNLSTLLYVLLYFEKTIHQNSATMETSSTQEVTTLTDLPSSSQQLGQCYLGDGLTIGIY